MPNPTFSVITPTFNCANTLGKTITSLGAQSLTDWEHIVIDGGSTDNTKDILLKYSHVRWISEKDNGVYDAMNKGIKMAQGNWIYFLGSDDVFKNNRVLENVTSHIQNVDVIFGDVVSTRFGGRYDGPFDVGKIFKKNICHQAIFFNRSIFEKLGLFDLKYPYHSDWEYNFRWLLNQEIRHKYIDLVIADYADGGLSSSNSDHRFKADKLRRYLKYGYKSLDKVKLRSLVKKALKQNIRLLHLKDLWFNIRLYFYTLS